MPRIAKAHSKKKGDKGESVGGYFRAIFEGSPGLLDSRSNADLLNLWLKEHPEEKEVPGRIKNILANIKSVMRKELRKGRKKTKKKLEKQITHTMPVQEMDFVEVPLVNPLELLEEQIDECLTHARRLDLKKLDNVVKLLRRARNAVVWIIGE